MLSARPKLSAEKRRIEALLGAAFPPFPPGRRAHLSSSRVTCMMIRPASTKRTSPNDQGVSILAERGGERASAQAGERAEDAMAGVSRELQAACRHKGPLCLTYRSARGD